MQAMRVMHSARLLVRGVVPLEAEQFGHRSAALALRSAWHCQHGIGSIELNLYSRGFSKLLSETGEPSGGMFKATPMHEFVQVLAFDIARPTTPTSAAEALWKRSRSLPVRLRVLALPGLLILRPWGEKEVGGTGGRGPGRGGEGPGGVGSGGVGTGGAKDVARVEGDLEEVEGELRGLGVKLGDLMLLASTVVCRTALHGQHLSHS